MLHFIYFVIVVLFTHRDGEEWKTNRSLHHKQIRPVNVHSYCPGLNKATDRLLRKLQSSRDEEGYVKDIHQHVMNWTMEGNAEFSWRTQYHTFDRVTMYHANPPFFSFL